MPTIAVRPSGLAVCLVRASRPLFAASNGRLAGCCAVDANVVRAAAAVPAHKVVKRYRASVFYGTLCGETSLTTGVGGVAPIGLPRCWPGADEGERGQIRHATH